MVLLKLITQVLKSSTAIWINATWKRKYFQCRVFINEHLVALFLRVRLINRCIQYIQRNMHTVFALLCFVVVIHWLIFPYPSGLLHWHCGNLTIAPVPAKQTLMNMDKYFMWIHYERLHNHNKAKHNKIVCIFLGIYCISILEDSAVFLALGGQSWFYV